MMNHTIKTESEARLEELLRSPQDAYAILQLPSGDMNRGRIFLSYDELRRQGEKPEFQHYSAIYTGVPPRLNDRNRILESLYEQFNLSHPADFKGRSLSVSDIVLMKVHGQLSCHYVDSIGFKELPEFLEPEEYLRCAELYLEDDYGMLDGIINNGKSEQAKALEDKPSVLEQLRNTETVPRRTDRKADTWELE